MKGHLFTTAFALLATCSVYASARERMKVETLHRIASENAACLEGCRILGKNVIKTVGTPEKMGKFIARSLINEAISLHHYLSILPAEVRQFKRMRNSLFEYNRELSRTNHFDIDGFIGKVEELQDYTSKAATELGNVSKEQVSEMLPSSPGHKSAASLRVLNSSLTTMYDLKVDRLAKLLENAKTYKNAINSGSGFILNINIKRKRYSGLETRGIRITRLAGPILFILGEFFFSERISAASLDDFDIEVSPQEYELFYAAVEMERDRLLPYLENSDNPESRDLALQIRSEIEERR